MANFILYTLTSSKKDEYTVCCRVGNTVIYAESNKTDSSKIKNVMKEIGYFDD